jgi:hypothetical protein
MKRRNFLTSAGAAGVAEYEDACVREQCLDLPSMGKG